MPPNTNGAEQTLEDYETCCLSTVFLPNVESYEEFLDILELSYRINKHSLMLPCHHPETEEVVWQNMRMGINVTGLAQASGKQISWLDSGYEFLRKFDTEYSRKIGTPTSIKLTTVQPSGCQSKDTLIDTENGLLYLDEIGNVNGEKWQNLEFEVAQENCTQLATKFYVNGKAKTKKIKLDSGLELEATHNHQYRIIRNNEYVWEKVENLKEGDSIVYSLNTLCDKPYVNLPIREQQKTINQPTILDEDLAYILGLYYADGSNHAKGIRIAGNTTTKYENMLFTADLFEKIFNITPKLYVRNNTVNFDLYLTSMSLLRWLSAQNLLKKDPISIPLAIRCSPKSVILSFIDGFFSGDGDVKKNGLRRFTTTSLQFAKELLVLMRAVGIDCKFAEMPPTKSSWGNKMRYQISERKGRKANPRYISNAQRDNWDVLNELSLNHCSTDNIVQITDSECDTYDIEVSVNNTYIANSYVSHNTMSLLPGVTAGVHPAYAQYMIRRVRIQSEHPLVDQCRTCGYPVEYAREFDGSLNYGTSIISIPFSYPEGTLLAKDQSAIDMLEFVRKMQRTWSDNAVSCSIYYDKEELPEIIEYLKQHYEHNFKTLSFFLKSDHGFDQAPLEEITKAEYEKLMFKITPISEVMALDVGDDECTTGHCPIR